MHICRTKITDTSYHHQSACDTVHHKTAHSNANWHSNMAARPGGALFEPPNFVPAVEPVRDHRDDRGPSSAPVKMTVWSHELKTTPNEVIVDMSLLPDAREGDVAEIMPAQSGGRKLYFVVRKVPDELKKHMANVQVCCLL